jgi:CheY-like chemotaxis protein
MSQSDTSLTILHVEDDPHLVKLVQIAFEKFGFRGRMLSAGRVDRALELLDDCARKRESISLILVDMQLPDGTGLDVIREVKSDPAWHLTPVIALSSEVANGMISGAYALGANCFLPKSAGSKGPFDSIRNLYKCWLEDVFLPQHPPRDRLQDALSQSVRLRARASDFYLRLARLFNGDSDEMGFWLDRSLGEGNLSNLLAFFQNRLSEKNVPVGLTDRITDMQVKVRNATVVAEKRLLRPAPSREEAYRWVFDLVGALDEEVVAEVLGCLFPIAPAATAALKARAAAQFRELATHILERTEDAELGNRARSLLDWAERLGRVADVAKV